MPRFAPIAAFALGAAGALARAGQGCVVAFRPAFFLLRGLA